MDPRYRCAPLRRDRVPGRNSAGSTKLETALGLWGGIAIATAVATALAFQFLGVISSSTSATLQAIGAGALIAMAAETMIPEAFHNGPRYSGMLAAGGFSSLLLIAALVR